MVRPADVYRLALVPSEGSRQLEVYERLGRSLAPRHVRIRDLNEREISDYLACGEAYDKAGSYAIQGKAAVFIPEIAGSYSGVMGLPLFETAQLLEESGIRIFRASHHNN